MARRNLKTGTNTFSNFGLNTFSGDDLDNIHYATLEVLQYTGVKIESKEALEIFHNFGATVESFDNYGIVKIPPYLVEECIRNVPSKVVFSGREPKNDFIVEPGRVGYTNFGEGVKIIDIDKKEVRKTVKKDCEQIIRVCDYLDEIDICEKPVVPSDINPNSQSLHQAEAFFTNTSKHIFMGAGNAGSLEKIIELAAACVGGMNNLKKRPIFTVNICPTSPLTLVKNACEVIINAARSGIGINVISMGMAGATTPITLAGTMVVHNAEVLSAIILAQLVSRGIPCVYASTSTIMDLKQATSPVGSPEFAIINAAAAKIAHYYSIPSWVGGGWSDSKLPDAQASHEATQSILMSTLAGANVVWGSGVLDQGLIFDYAKLLMDSEIIKMVKFSSQGMSVTDEEMAVDIIKEVGPGGQYIAHEHTYKNMKIQSQTKLLDRRNYDLWKNDMGGKNMTERAYEEAKSILNNHKPLPLPQGAAEGMKEIINEYEKELHLNNKKSVS